VTGSESSGRAECHEPDCSKSASFRLFDRPAGRWRPICERHARTIHPSLELGLLLESGYLKPIELVPPDSSPAEPVTPRDRAFRESVERLLGWAE
jgi:hypothetical protein